MSDYDDSSEDYDKNFSNPFIATITTIRMMLSDFDKVDVDATDYIKGIIFLLFVVLITIVLFNLLNALAISDTAEIMIDAELVDIQKRVSILYTYIHLRESFHGFQTFVRSHFPQSFFDQNQAEC